MAPRRSAILLLAALGASFTGIGLASAPSPSKVAPTHSGGGAAAAAASSSSGAALASSAPAAEVPPEQLIAPPTTRRALLREVEAALGAARRGDTERRLKEIETALGPTYAALPKNRHGKLDHGATRYALHRLFVHRRGWVIRGLETAGEAPGNASATDLLDDRVPELVQERFERVIGAGGATLSEVAVLAATLEHLIHNEMVGKLEAAYSIRNLSTDVAVNSARARDLISLYMMSFIRGYDLTELASAPKRLARFEANMHFIYPPWEDFRAELQLLQAQMFPRAEAALAFDDVARILATVVDRFVRWQDSQCRSLKGLLVGMEDQGTGRVRLLDFYSGALDRGIYQFTETQSYLRHLGALDESDALRPRVIIPNYVAGPSNCVSRTQYYSVCCLNECEGLLRVLEARLGKGEATPKEIVVAVQGLPSATVSSNWTLSSFLLERLQQVAGTHHGGLVPLHGRLFAQWLHLVYPRECAYPHLSGTTYKKTLEEWSEETGERAGATVQELKEWRASLSRSAIVAVKRRDSQSAPNGSRVAEGASAIMQGMWTLDEELIVGGTSMEELFDDRARAELATVHGLILLLGVVSAAVSLYRTSGLLARCRRSPKKKRPEQNHPEFFV